MKKSFPLENLGCAHCAAQMEKAIAKLPSVEQVHISIVTQRLSLSAKDMLFDQILQQAMAIMKKIEPGCRMLT